MLRLLAVLAGAVAVGVLSRVHPLDWRLYDKSLGDVLYAVVVYLCVALLLRRRRPVIIGSLALALCLAVEGVQATGLPARYAHLGPVRWLLGTTFAWHDVACYLVGVGLIAVVDAKWLRPCREASPQ